MAQLYKNSLLNDEAFPMPRPATPLSEPQRFADGSTPAIDASQVRQVAGDLEQVMAMVGSLRPALEQLNESVRANAEQRGYNEGLARAQTEVQQHVMAAMAALTEAQQQRQRLAEQHEGALADLALKIARKVIAAQIDVDPTLVSRIVAQTIAELEPTAALTVHANPADVPALEASRAELERLVMGAGSVQIVADDDVDRGGCVLVSPVGDVDARIATKLGVLESAFRAQRREMAGGDAA